MPHTDDPVQLHREIQALEVDKTLLKNALLLAARRMKLIANTYRTGPKSRSPQAKTMTKIMDRQHAKIMEDIKRLEKAEAAPNGGPPGR